jgi:hypothetical protein
MDEATAARDVVRQPRKARAEQRRARLVHAVVVSQFKDVVVGGVAAVAVPGAGRHCMGAPASRQLGHAVVVRGQQAALAAAEHLVREEAERAREPPGPGLAVAPHRSRAGGVCGVLDQRDAPLVAQLPQRGDVRRVAAVMDGADRLGLGRDTGLDVVRIDSQIVLSTDLGEDRGCAAVAGRSRRRHERDGRHDHLVSRPDSRREICEVECRCAARERDGVARAEVLGELLLECLRPRAHGQPPRAQRRGDGLDLLLGQPDVE